MKEKVRIASLLTNTALYGKTLIDGVWKILTNDFQELSLYEFENNPEHKGKKMFVYEFTESRKVFDFEFETTDKPFKPKPEKPKDASPRELEAHLDLVTQITKDNLAIDAENLLNRRKRSAVKNFFARHQQISHKTDFGNGHVCTLQPVATIEVLTQVAKMNVMSDWKKVRIFLKFMSLTWQQQCDAAMHYAPHLYGKRRSEVINGMVGIKGVGTKEAYLGGALWQGKNADDFLTKYEDNPTVAMKIYISKAAALGLLTKGNNGLYMKGSTFVGSTIDEAVVFFSHNMSDYTDYIQPSVNKGFELPEDDMVEDEIKPTISDFEKKEIQKAKQEDWMDERKRTLQEASLLGIGEPQKIKQADLLIVIEAAKAKQNAIEQNEGLPSQILEMAIDDLATDDIDKVHAIARAEGVKGVHLIKDIDKLKERIRAHRKELSGQPA